MIKVRQEMNVGDGEDETFSRSIDFDPLYQLMMVYIWNRLERKVTRRIRLREFNTTHQLKSAVI